ncbi:hypothetical protein ES703_75363 [subsurface metagenome]
MKISYSNLQLTILVSSRLLIGWLCLYEGITKVMNPNWTSFGYMIDSKGIFSGLFHSLAFDPTVLEVVDFFNIWGLIAIGSGLILGLFTRIATIAGIVILSLYYLSHPPLIGAEYALPAEGNYLWVNKTLIEIFLLAILLVFPTGSEIGLDRFIYNRKSKKK